jgi:hypothetical protein
MGGKVQKSSALRAGQPGRDVDDAAPKGRAACSSVTVPGQHTGSPHQVVGDRRAQHPGGVRPEPARGKVGQWPVDEVGDTVSMIACWRWVMSASAVGRSVLVKNG